MESSDLVELPPSQPSSHENCHMRREILQENIPPRDLPSRMDTAVRNGPRPNNNGNPRSQPRQGLSQIIRNRPSNAEPNRRPPTMVNSSIIQRGISHTIHDPSLPPSFVPPTCPLPRVEGRLPSVIHDMEAVPPDRRDHPPNPNRSNRQTPSSPGTTPDTNTLTPAILSAQVRGHVDYASTSGPSHQNMICSASRKDATSSN